LSTMPKFRIGVSTREWSRYCSLRDLSLTYEGQSEAVAVHPPDISPKGMFINTPVHFPEGSVLKVSFRLARSNHHVETRCEVRYCMPGIGVGVEFIGIAPKDQKAISDEIQSIKKGGKEGGKKYTRRRRR
jgi:PilZ domain